jgi:argininosuccinate lyase
MLGATDVADLLVRRGVPFREAHGIVGGLVRHAIDTGRTLSELSVDEVAERAPQLDAGLADVLRRESVLESKVSEGGTALPAVREQIARARRVLQESPA